MGKKKEKRKRIAWHDPRQLLMEHINGEKESKKKENYVESSTPTPYGLLQWRKRKKKER
jgi:hypothetical protein